MASVEENIRTLVEDIRKDTAGDNSLPNHQEMRFLFGATHPEIARVLQVLKDEKLIVHHGGPTPYKVVRSPEDLVHPVETLVAYLMQLITEAQKNDKKTRLPTTQHLAKLYQLSCKRIDMLYADLETQGLIVNTGTGSGRFVITATAADKLVSPQQRIRECYKPYLERAKQTKKQVLLPSQADVAKRTETSKVTVGKVIAEMVAAGICTRTTLGHIILPKALR